MHAAVDHHHHSVILQNYGCIQRIVCYCRRRLVAVLHGVTRRGAIMLLSMMMRSQNKSHSNEARLHQL
jgi:hypothetical protein